MVCGKILNSSNLVLHPRSIRDFGQRFWRIALSNLLLPMRVAARR